MSMTSQTTPAPPAAQEKANGLATYLGVIFSPSEAFATLGRVPMWGWAAILGIVLTIVGQVILWPATIHIAHASQAQALAQMPADQAAQAREGMSKIPDFVYPLSGIIGAGIFLWLAWLIFALIYLGAAALTGGEARFKLAWALSLNLYAIPALGAIIAGVIVMLRGAENVSTAVDLFALPSPAMLVHGSKMLTSVLYSFNIVNIWLYIVAAVALQQTMKLSRGAAIGTVVVLALLGVGLSALGALVAR